MEDFATLEPVTVSGWYENTDGTVSRYEWRNGRLDRDHTVPSWADVPKQWPPQQPNE